MKAHSLRISSAVIFSALLCACNGGSETAAAPAPPASGVGTPSPVNTGLQFSWSATTSWHEDFEGPTALSEWRFNAGTEFGPGAQGKLSGVNGQPSGNALELAYSTEVCDAKGCPVYAAAVHTLKKPVVADTLRFKLKNALPREVRVYASVKDSSGQTFQYRPERCPFETSQDTWCTLESDLRMPSLHWGGANDGVMRGEITEVSVLVQPLVGVRGRVPIQGTAVFDDVTLANAPSTVSLNRTAAGNGLASATWRDLKIENTTARLGVASAFKGHRTDSQRRLQKAKEAGFGFVRTDVFWSHVETQRGTYDFSAADQLLEDARAMGLKVLFILDYENPLYRDGVLMSTEGERNAFAAYAAAAAARFKGRGVRYEIWNEQNSGAVCPTGNEGFWRPSPNAQHYASLVAATTQAIRQVDASAEVTLGGITASFTSSCDQTPTLFSFQYLDGVAGAGGLMNVNALGYHPYYDIAEQWGAELHMLRTSLRDKGFPTLPVWDTEWGVSSACPDGERPCALGDTAAKRDRQAVRLARRFLVGLALDLPVNVWYDLVDDGVDPTEREHNFGLYDTQFNGKPALAAMQTLAEVSKERLSGLAPDLPAGMHALRFQQGLDTIYAIWVERGSVQLTSDTKGLIRAVDVQGKDLPLSGDWMLRESTGPLYLTYR